jgi:hypothetical protein
MRVLKMTRTNSTSSDGENREISVLPTLLVAVTRAKHGSKILMAGSATFLSVEESYDQIVDNWNAEIESWRN